MSDVCHGCGRQGQTLVPTPVFVIPDLGAESSTPLARLKFASGCRGQDRPKSLLPLFQGLLFHSPQFRLSFLEAEADTARAVCK